MAKGQGVTSREVLSPDAEALREKLAIAIRAQALAWIHHGNLPEPHPDEAVAPIVRTIVDGTGITTKCNCKAHKRGRCMHCNRRLELASTLLELAAEVKHGE